MPTGVYPRTKEMYESRGKGFMNEGNPAWKGNKIGYSRIHKWLAEKFGRASKCENIRCSYPRRNGAGSIVKMPRRFEYALIRGMVYKRKRENFIQLCPSCHRKYDNQ